MNIYQENGFKNRKEYLEDLADMYDVDYDIVKSMSDTLGSSEDFDGLVSMLEEDFCDLVICLENQY